MILFCIFKSDKQQDTNPPPMIIKDKVIYFFCIIDEFDKNFEQEMKKFLPAGDGKKHRKQKTSLSNSGIMAILLLFHFGTYRKFKHYYLCCIRGSMKLYFPSVVSYNRFVKFEQLVFFLKLFSFGRCAGISFVDSTKIQVCHNLRHYANKMFKGVALTAYNLSMNSERT